MKSTIKKIFITYLVIICCIYTPTAQAAGWSFGGYNFGNGSLNIVKDGVKITTAAVDSAPITSNLGSKILSGALRGASVLSAISIIADLGGAAVDWVLDPANNAVKYRTKAVDDSLCADYIGSTWVEGTPEYFAKEFIKYWYGDDRSWSYNPTTGELSVGNGVGRITTCGKSTDVPYKSIPIPTVAQQILNNAKSGDTNAQADVTAAVTELVNAGTYDTPINEAIQQAIDNGTLPKDTDTNTDTNNPTNPQIDTSSIIAAIQSLASSFESSISNAFNGITSVINTSIDKILNKQEQMQGEVVNVGSKVDSVGGQVVGVGDKVDNVGGKVVGVGEAVKDVGGKVVGLNDSVDKIGDKVVGVGDKVTAGTDAVGTKVDAVGDKVTGVGTRVDAVGDKVDAASDKVADAVKESTKEITKKMDETKPKDFELPAFCSWASKVCDFIDWFMVEPDIEGTPVPTDNTPLKNPGEFDKDYVSVVAQCPPDVVSEIPLPGQSFNLVFGMSPVCDFASTYLRPVIIFLAYIYGALSIGNAFRVGG